MWRLTYLRDWWNHQLDRFVERRIRRAADRVSLGIERWMADNASREDEP